MSRRYFQITPKAISGVGIAQLKKRGVVRLSGSPRNLFRFALEMEGSFEHLGESPTG